MAALVTGRSGGTGSAVARWLAGDGASVTIMTRTESSIRSVYEELLKYATSGAMVQFHVGDARSVQNLQEVLKATTRPQVHSISACRRQEGGIKPLLIHEAQSFMEDIDLNILSAFLAMCYARC
jgi:NADP-dependent 3-hydroxy acid dehydrogenase YdfG